MKQGQRLVTFVAGGVTHVTCTGARKGWTVCGLLVPTTPVERLSGNAAALERELHRRRACRNCDRMKDAYTA